MAKSETWNAQAARTLRENCYKPDGEPPLPDTIGRDLAWWRFKITVHGETPERITLAIQGAPLVMTKLQKTKWSPAKCFSKKGPWTDLFSRAITAAGKLKRAKAERMPESIRAIMRQLAE